jgi:hypothetical protein
VTLSPTVQPHHVEEAIRLFKFSTMDAVSAGSVDGLTRSELNEEIDRIEKELKRRLPIGWSTSYQSLVREFVGQQGYTQHALERCLFVMEKREVIRFSGQKKVVVRYVPVVQSRDCFTDNFLYSGPEYKTMCLLRNCCSLAELLCLLRNCCTLDRGSCVVLVICYSIMVHLERKRSGESSEPI